MNKWYLCLECWGLNQLQQLLETVIGVPEVSPPPPRTGNSAL